MKTTPIEFLKSLKDGKTERECNLTESMHVDPIKFNELISKKYGHSIESAIYYLLTDYSNGFTICKKCGSFYHLGKGFIKHLSNGCLHCEGEEKHNVYHVNASKPRDGGFSARFMSVMFDDGLSYCKDKLQIEKYSDLI